MGKRGRKAARVPEVQIISVDGKKEERGGEVKSEIAVSSKVEEFRTALQEGIGGIVKASEIYVAAIDENPRNADAFRDAFSEWVPASAWSQFEAVGRKWMHPRMLMGGVADKKKATIIKRLPYSMQDRVFKKDRFPLLTVDGDTLQVDVLEATASQAEQLFNGPNLRSLGEQRAWLESRKVAQKDEIAEMLPYVITDGKVTFRRGCVLNRSELRRLLQEM
jgi:hypothetical protein